MKLFARYVLALALACLGNVAIHSAELADGTLLFLENCSSVVERATHGEIAHVALVFRDGDERCVYEATPAKVRRVTLDDYLLELSKLNDRRRDSDIIRARVLRPTPAYTTEETAAMKKFLDEQIGRRYSVKNYVRGKPYDGIHCAELTGRTLNASGRYALEDCHKINPKALYELVVPTHATFQWLEIPPLEAKEPLLVRWQRKTAGWMVWCRWSWREAWLFLW